MPGARISLHTKGTPTSNRDTAAQVFIAVPCSPSTSQTGMDCCNFVRLVLATSPL